MGSKGVGNRSRIDVFRKNWESDPERAEVRIANSRTIKLFGHRVDEERDGASLAFFVAYAAALLTRYRPYPQAVKAADTLIHGTTHISSTAHVNKIANVANGLQMGVENTGSSDEQLFAVCYAALISGRLKYAHDEPQS